MISQFAKNSEIIKKDLDLKEDTEIKKIFSMYAEDKSINDENTWLYFERILSKGKYHKLGKHVLKSNNTLVLTFDKYGILKSKKFYNKENLKKVNFSKKETENELTKKSFVGTFLSSVKEKMYGSNRKKKK